MKNFSLFLLFICFIFVSCEEEPVPVDPGTPIPTEVLYTMPEESVTHEGTWLQWPHQYQYGVDYRNELDATWVAMTSALVSGEKVHLVAYDQTEKTRIEGLLAAAGVSTANIDFKIYPTDDVWVRDNGPIYVRDKSGSLVIQDWGFNGWGGKHDSNKCNSVPSKIGNDQSRTVVDLNTILVNEGGSVEIDGNGTLMACKSSILNGNRNPGKTQAEVESVFTKYLGVTNFVWLDGKAGLDITDMHIDGFARFANSSTIVTMSDSDLDYWQVPASDVPKLKAAKNKTGAAYQFVIIPLSKNEVVKTDGTVLSKGSYINYYIGNTKVLVPNYNDPNDAVANQIIQGLYPGKQVVGIDCRNLFSNGGMMHCVTQQQPQ
jgi:agmatine deiminase